AYDPAAVSAEIRAIVSALTDKGARVITVGLFDRSYSPAVPEQFRKPLQERIHGLSQSTREIAKDLGTLHIDLTWHPAVPEPGLYSSDGRHSSMRGHAISAAEVITGLGADLATAGGPATAARRGGAHRAGAARPPARPPPLPRPPGPPPRPPRAPRPPPVPTTEAREDAMPFDPQVQAIHDRLERDRVPNLYTMSI